MTDEMYHLKELGLKLVEYAYANQYAELGDLNDLAEFKEQIAKDVYTLFKDEIKEYMEGQE